MTCIVGYIDKNKDVYIGGDSAGTDIHYNSRIRKDAKVFKIADDIIIGGTGSFRMLQLLRFKLHAYLNKEIEINNQQKYIPEIYEFMCTTFIDAVRLCLKENGYMHIDNNVEEIGAFLVGFQGRLFDIECDLQVGENNTKFSACGCGADYAIGALNILTTKEKLGEKIYIQETNPIKIVNKALETAEKFSAACRKPNVILKLEYKQNAKEK